MAQLASNFARLLPPRPHSVVPRPPPRAGAGRLGTMATVPDVEEQQLHTMDIAEILPSLPPEAPVQASTPPPLRRPTPGRKLALDRKRVIAFVRVVAFFFAYVAVALARWPLRALPHLRAFAASVNARLRMEWARASSRAGLESAQWYLHDD